MPLWISSYSSSRFLMGNVIIKNILGVKYKSNPVI